MKLKERIDDGNNDKITEFDEEKDEWGLDHYLYDVHFERVSVCEKMENDKKGKYNKSQREGSADLAVYEPRMRDTWRLGFDCFVLRREKGSVVWGPFKSSLLGFALFPILFSSRHTLLLTYFTILLRNVVSFIY